ncbi:efflux RND transporter periplasmic adaptor subunit [Alloacidobacterium dinghuense]|uniref:Efflux RND transporter periplasmic adaptor subunit n=1 Tax=Alloacidobacterium dinghuense TaxID=2763107 RepID=A0A7G8BJM7_9BACT|nr:efflux RND transporter periplasmic adaptor subunit [Alloacidobacterium dinghuense]QNI32747.1 efflux RND transporter periplasmic adaptor subunit [Alloacidobacterium dinghuense]
MTVKPFGLLLISSISVALAGCNKQEQDPRTQPPLVRLATVHSASASDQFFTGVVTARVQSDLGFRVSGKVTQRLVDVGQVVHVGQPLMRIDVTDYAHAVTNQEEQVRAAKAKADQTAADEARYRPLVASGAVSASTYDQVKAAADSARAELEAFEAQAKIARDQGDYSVLVADSDGTVVDTLAEPGQVVAAGQTVIKLAHAGPREAAVYLPETLRPRLGSSVRAILYGSSESVPANLRQLSDAADPSTRTFEARYVLKGTDAKAPLGATVTVQIPLADASDTVAVPNTAITDRGNGPGVWMVNRNSSTVSFQPVKIVRLGEEETYIDDGIRPGETIVALGAHLLSEGQRVRIAENEVATR